MPTSRTFRAASFVALTAALAACATTPNAFERHDRWVAEQEAAATSAERVVCPVSLSNATDQELDVGYEVGGVPSVLGLIPAGRSLSFGVLCDSGAIEAFGVSSTGGLFGSAYEYRTTSPVDPGGSTRLSLSTIDRVR